MATVPIPILASRGATGKMHFKIRQELDGVFYRLAFHYNGTFDSWFMDFSGDNDLPIVAGQRVKLTTDSLRQFKHLDVPQGELRVVDGQGQHQEPTRENFGDRVIVEYVEESD